MYDVPRLEDGIEYKVTHIDNLVIWTCNGKLHRMKGPAVISTNPGEPIKSFWWYQGTNIKCNSQEEYEKLISLMIFW